MSEPANTNDLFLVRLHLVILSTEIEQNKQYVLSTDKEVVEFPYLYLNKSFLDGSEIDSKIIKYIQQNIMAANEIELLPQPITIHDKELESTNDTLNCVYGFIVPHTGNINTEKVSWKEFNYTDTKHNALITRVVQALR